MIYRHFKGGYYLKICSARHHETRENHAVYMALQSNGESKIGQKWIRPTSEFHGIHETAAVKRMTNIFTEFLK